MKKDNKTKRHEHKQLKKVEVVLDNLLKLKPLLDGSSGTYLGVYSEPAKAICEQFGWEFTET